jgi:hypothetical protein
MTQDSAPRLGKFRILDEIGRGGFGVVYRAEDTLLANRIVALKVLHPQLVVDQAFVKMFTKEAGTAASLEHPHIVTIFEPGIFEERRYIAMRYLPGPSLAQVLIDEGAQPLDRVIAWTTQVASALDYAHAAGVIHRDVKPGNILLNSEKQAVVTDFGLARAAEHSGAISSAHSSGIMTGTARYIAPEQARLGKAFPQSDIYSLGIVVYELITGRVPFDEGDNFAIAYQHVNEPPPPPRQFCPDLPIQVERVILQALEKDPANRYDSAGQFAQALHDAAQQAQQKQEREDQLLALFTRFCAFEQAGDWISAVKAGEELEDQSPGYEDVPQRLIMARERLHRQQEEERLRQAEEEEARQLAGLYTELQAAVDAGKWLPAIELATTLQEKSPGYRDVSDCLAHAQRMHQQALDEEKQRRREEEKKRRLEILYETLLQREKLGDWPGVLSLAGEILTVEPDFRDVVKRKKHAEKEYKALTKLNEKTTPPDGGGGHAPAWQLRILIAVLILSALGGVYYLFDTWVLPDDDPSETQMVLATRTPRPTFTLGPKPTDAPSAEPEEPPTIAEVTPAPAISATATLTPTPTFTPTFTPTNTPTLTPTPTPSPTDKPVPTAPAPESETEPEIEPESEPVPAPAPIATTLTGRIAFSIFEPGNNTYTLFSIKPDGTDRRWLGDHLRQPSYRQDGELIVANGQGGGRNDLWTVNPNGSGTISSMGHLDDEHPVWLSSRQYHVGSDSLRWGDGNWRIYLGDNPISYGGGGILGRYPVWIPGQLVAYSGCDYGFGTGSRCGLYKVSMWGGVPVRILDDANAIPTGGGDAGVLLTREIDGNWDVYLVGSSGGNPQRLTDHAAIDGLATFSPDGKTIAFVSDRSGNWAIWLMNRDGSNERKIYDFSQGQRLGNEWYSERISWGPVKAAPAPAPSTADDKLLEPPTIVWPRENDPIRATKPYEVQWTWEGRPLAENEAFEVRLRADLKHAPQALAAPTKATSLGVTFGYSSVYLGPDTYYLDIVLIQIDTKKVLSRPAGPISIRLLAE